MGWLAEHKGVRDAIVWEDNTGAHKFIAWPSERQQELLIAVDEYLAGGSPLVPLDPPNVLSLSDTDFPSTALSSDDAWALFRAYVAHSLAVDISESVSWRLDDYSAADRARLLSSKEMFRLVNGAYKLDDVNGRAVPASPLVVRAFLFDAGIVADNRVDTIARLLNWCRNTLEHHLGPTAASSMQAAWQYRGWPPVSRVLAGTTDTDNPTFGQKHWTAGCHGTCSFLRSVLRGVNLPATTALRVDHSLPHFTTDKIYLSHGDDPYSQISRAMPEINGHSLMITQKDFDARFTNPTEDDVGYRVWRLGLGEVWRGTWNKGWSSIVPLQMGDIAHYLAYKTGNGEVAIDRMRPDGQDVDTLWKDTWTTGWSAFVPFTRNGTQYYLAYKVKTGRVVIDRVRPDGQGVDNAWEDIWTTGWTSLVPFTLRGEPHYLAYKVDTGDVSVDRIRPDASGIDTIWSGKWTRGWTGFAILPMSANPLLFSIKSVVPTNPLLATFLSMMPFGPKPVSQLALDEIHPDGQITPLWNRTDKPGWSSVMQFEAPYGAGPVMLYNISTGVLKVLEVTHVNLASGPLTQVKTAYREQWTTGWTSIETLQAYGRPWYLTYKRAKRTVTINHLCG